MTDEIPPPEDVDFDDPRFGPDVPGFDSDPPPEAAVLSAGHVRKEDFPGWVRPPTFDPNAPIDPAPFQALVGTGKLTAEEALLRDPDFGQMKPEDVGGRRYFDGPPGVTEAEGEFSFRVEQRHLVDALAAVEVTVQQNNEHFNKVKLTLLRTRLTLATCCGAAFTEFAIPLFGGPSPSLPTDEDPPVAVVFEHKLLLRLARWLPQELAVVEFTYIRERQILRFQTLENPDDPNSVVQKDYRLTCWPLTDFPNYRTQIPRNPELLSRVHAVLLRKAVNYVGIFARKDETQSKLNLIELRDGVMTGGTQRQIGRLESAALKGLNLQIKYDFVKPLGKILALMNADDTSVYETKRYYLVTDGTLIFGFERYSFNFPDVSGMYQHESDNHVLVPRKEFLNALALLAAVNKDDDLLVELSMKGEGNHIRLDLLTRERCGQPCRDFVRVFRNFNPGKTTSSFPDWAFSVQIAVLLELVRHFESTNVHLEVYNDTALYIYDEEGWHKNEARYTARSLLSHLTPRQAHALKEQKAQDAAGKRDTIH